MLNWLPDTVRRSHRYDYFSMSTQQPVTSVFLSRLMAHSMWPNTAWSHWVWSLHCGQCEAAHQLLSDCLYNTGLHQSGCPADGRLSCPGSWGFKKRKVCSHFVDRWQLISPLSRFVFRLRHEQAPLLPLRAQLPAHPPPPPGADRSWELQTRRVPLEAGPGPAQDVSDSKHPRSCSSRLSATLTASPCVCRRCATKSGITMCWTWSSPPCLCLWTEPPLSPSWSQRITRCTHPRSKLSSPSVPAGKVRSLIQIYLGFLET